MKKTRIFICLAAALMLLSAPFGASAQVNTITIGNISAWSDCVPTACDYNNSIAQFIYTADELGGTPFTIESITFLHMDTPDLGGGNLEIERSFKVYIANTSQSDYSSDGWVTYGDLVGEGLTVPGISGGSQPLTFTLSSPFFYNGNSNLCITVVDNNNSNEDFHYFAGDNVGTAPRSLYARSNTSTYSISNPPTNAGSTTFRPYIKLGVNSMVISGPTTGNSGEELQFTCSGYSNWTYSWSIEDCYTSSSLQSQSVSAAWRLPGTYRLYVHVYDMPISLGTSDTARVTISPREPETTVASTAQWYAFSYPGVGSVDSCITFSMQHPEQKQSIQIISRIHAAEYANGKIYVQATRDGVHDKLFSHPFDAANPSIPTLDEMTEVGIVNNIKWIIDMSYNIVNNTMYGMVRTNDGESLASIDLATANVTTIGNTAPVTMLSFAINATGDAYSIADDGNLYSVNLADGTISLIGPTGLECSSGSYGLTMSFDRATGELFWYRYYYDSEQRYDGIYKVNTTTGHADFVGYTYNRIMPLHGLFTTSGNISNGISEVKELDVAVAPNPTTGIVRVECAEPVQRLEVISLQGSLMKSAAGTREVDLTGLAAGTYLLRVTTESGTTTRNVVLQ